LIMAARRSRRGISVLRRDFEASVSEMAFNDPIEPRNQHRNKSRKCPSRNAGAAACEMTSDS
jgi:hypothetical protein